MIIEPPQLAGPLRFLLPHQKLWWGALQVTGLAPVTDGWITRYSTVLQKVYWSGYTSIHSVYTWYIYNIYIYTHHIYIYVIYIYHICIQNCGCIYVDDSNNVHWTGDLTGISPSEGPQHFTHQSWHITESKKNMHQCISKIANFW
jgi:hypothetical protein